MDSEFRLLCRIGSCCIRWIKICHFLLPSFCRLGCKLQKKVKKKKKQQHHFYHEAIEYFFIWVENLEEFWKKCCWVEIQLMILKGERHKLGLNKT